ncbi:MAG: hypothetical protein AAGI07_11835 [Bacteroidota bacterium]
MKKKLLVLLVSLFLCFTIYGQEKDRKNALYLEGLGATVVGVGIGYERYFKPKPILRFAARGGLGLVESFTQLSPHAGASVMIGKNLSFEIGFNFLINPDIEEGEDFEVEMDTAFQTLAGLRYQNFTDGFLFRIFFVPPFGAFEPSYIYIPYGGLSIGYIF